MSKDPKDPKHPHSLQPDASWAARFVTPIESAGINAIRNFHPLPPQFPRPEPPLPPAPLPSGPHPPEPPREPRWPPQKNPPHLLCAEISALADQSLFVSSNHYWQNWPKTHGYVTSVMCFPKTVEEVGASVRLAEAKNLPVRAVGGGWSFSDASLPGSFVTVRADVPTADQLTRWLPFAEGFPPAGPSVAIIDPTDATLIGYDANNRAVPALAIPGAAILDGVLGPTQPAPVCLINTRSIKSSLQDKLDGILSTVAKQAIKRRIHYFHVEGGITIEELAPLLDAQSPRLVLEASGGNPGATLAGSISTGTHGAEFNTALLVDRVKAIHLVGPGGLQWWIEGDDSIADPDALMARYPCLARSRIITGADAVLGASPQEWLNAVVVSMGCIGVIYSVVLEVTELTGMRQVVSQTTWWRFLAQAKGTPVPVLPDGKPLQPVLQTIGLDGENELRIPALNPALSAAIVKILTDGSFSGQVPAGHNVYADMAFNPNRRRDGDLDCWIVNRNKVAVSFDPQPPSAGAITDVASAVFGAMADAFGGDVGALVNRLGRVYGFIDPVLGSLNQVLNPLAPIMNSVLQAVVPGTAGLILGQLLASANPIPLVGMITRISNAADKLDVALDELTKPMTNAQATDLAQPFLTGVLASTLGTAKSNPGISIGTSVGSVGFPNDGIVGAGLEVAMPVSAAFPFIQTEILDRMSPQLPFYGYISVRICPKTDSLLGMPQWDKSVMIEVVSFGDAWGRTFMAILQSRVVTSILAGKLDATLHWGLENDQLNSRVLNMIPAMQVDNLGAPFDRVAAFKNIRDQIRKAYGQNPGNLFRAFDNAFTARLGL
jgi:hypothetical protein